MNIKLKTVEDTGVDDPLTKSEQKSAASQKAVCRRRASIKMIQFILAVSSAVNAEKSCKDSQSMTNYLQRAVDDLITFTDDKECIAFIETLDEYEGLSDYFRLCRTTNCIPYARDVTSELNTYILLR